MGYGDAGMVFVLWALAGHVLALAVEDRARREGKSVDHHGVVAGAWVLSPVVAWILHFIIVVLF